MNKYLLPLTAAAILAGTSMAFAAQVSDPFTVRITINKSCSVTAADVNFSTLNVNIAGTETATGAVTVRCSKSTPFALSFAGPAAAAVPTAAGVVAGQVSSYTDGEMTHTVTATEKVLYDAEIRDSGASAISGGGTGTGGNQSFVIWAKLDVQDTPIPGDYQDTTRTLYVNY